MKRTIKSIISLLLIIFWAGKLQAQEGPITLEQLLRHADTASLSIRGANAGAEAARLKAHAVAENQYLPSLHLRAATGYLGNGYGWGRDSSYHFTVSMPHFSTQLGLEVEQVVYAGGALAAARRQAEVGAQLAQIDYQRQRLDLRLMLTGHYLDLYRLTKQIEVLDSNMALAERLIADIEAKCQQGAALRNDIMRHQLRLAELQSQRSSALCELKIAQRAIATLAGLPEGTVLTPDSSCLQTVGKTLTHVTPLSVQTADAQFQLSEEACRQARAAKLPYVALVARDELNGPVTIDITPYNINYNYWFVGLAVGYDISSLWKGNSQLKAARQQRQQRLLERQDAESQSRQAIEAATLRLEEAHHRLSVRRKSMRLAEENYTLMANRYAADLALLADMIDAANQRVASQLEYISARIEVVYRQSFLQYLHGQL